MESFEERPLRKPIHNIHTTKIIDREQSLNFTNDTQSLNSAVLFPCKDNFYSLISPKYLCNSTTNAVFNMGNKRNRRSRRVESQSSDRDENISETSFTQGIVTLVDVSENNIFDRNLGSELTEPSQISNEIEAISQRFSEQNNHKMTQIEQQLNSKFEEILKEIRTNKENNLVDDGEDAEDNRPSTSNSENGYLRKKHASNNEIDKNRNQENRFPSSEMHELRQPSTPFRANTTFDDTIVINENRQDNTDYHMVTGPPKYILRQSSNNSNTTNTVGDHLFLEHPEPSDPVNQIAQAIEKLARQNPEPSTFHSKNTLTFNGKLEKNEKFEYFEDLFDTTLKMQPHLTEEMKINHFYAHLRGLALKTFNNIQRTPTTTLEDILIVFRRKYVKPESSASTKHRFNRLMFQPENQKLPDFLENLQESAEKAFGEAAPQMIESLIYAKMPPHLKKSINQAYLENGTYEQIVRHLEREMEINGLEADEPLVKTQMTVVKQQSNSQNTETTQNIKPKTKTPNTDPNNTLQNNQCRYCKEEGHIAKECPKLAKRQKMDKDPDTPRCSHCNTPGHDEPNCYFGVNMENRPPKWTLTETQQKLIEEYKKSNKLSIHETQNLRHRRI